MTHEYYKNMAINFMTSIIEKFTIHLFVKLVVKITDKRERERDIA